MIDEREHMHGDGVDTVRAGYPNSMLSGQKSKEMKAWKRVSSRVLKGGCVIEHSVTPTRRGTCTRSFKGCPEKGGKSCLVYS